MKIFLSEQYEQLYKAVPVDDFCEEKSIELDTIEITKDNRSQFYRDLKTIITSKKTSYWMRIITSLITDVESFDLQFNVNNKEESVQKEVIFKSVTNLSLGQKVVAMLSFILSYSEYANDFTPLIIDQPEDNLDNQYIYRNLVNDLRTIKSKRQVLIATHSSTIVTKRESRTSSCNAI